MDNLLNIVLYRMSSPVFLRYTIIVIHCNIIMFVTYKLQHI